MNNPIPLRTYPISNVTRTAENLKGSIRRKQSSDEEGYLIIVEQEPVLQERWVNILKPLGLNCKCIDRGNLVYAELMKTKCALMITDLMLPTIDGIEVIMTIRETFDLDFPILVLSNLTSESVVNEAYLVGADDYLVKTETQDQDLLNTVNILLKKHARRLTRKVYDR